jgi:MoaD family protein
LEGTRVKVKYFSFFQDIAGKADEHIQMKEPSVAGLLKILEKRYPSKSGYTVFGQKSAKGRMEFMIIVNGKVANLEHPLKDNDEVSLLQPMGGG